MTFKLRKYQEIAVEKALWSFEEKEGNDLIVLPTACHSFNYPIRMFDGSIKAVQDIQVGDFVMGKDYSPRKVLKIFNGIDKFYEITTKSKKYFQVNQGHVLHLRKSGYEEFKNISLKNLLEGNDFRVQNLIIDFRLVTESGNSLDEQIYAFMPYGVQGYYGFELDEDHLYIDGQGFVHHNSGKGLIQAEIAHKLDREVIILQPSKIVLKQNVEKMLQYVPKEEVGIYSASMKRKDISKITYATIGSIYKKPELFKHIGAVILDEASDYNFKRTKGMYAQFMYGLGNPKTIGMDATPFIAVPSWHKIPDAPGFFEVNSTLKLINRMKPVFWDRIIFNANIKRLMDEGYLARPKYELIDWIEQKEIKLNTSKTDFDLEFWEEILSEKEQVVLDTIYDCQQRFNSNLVFCSSVKQAEKFASIIPNSEVVSFNTTEKERDKILEKFQTGEIKTVFNVSCMGIGYDFPKLECVTLLRPLRSLRQYIQFGGRVLRIAEGKEVGHFIDFTNTVSELGRIETIELVKENNKWEIKTEKGYFHNRPLYSFTIDTNKEK